MVLRKEIVETLLEFSEANPSRVVVIMTAVLRYGYDETEPNKDDMSSKEKLLWDLIKTSIDLDNALYNLKHKYNYELTKKD